MNAISRRANTLPSRPLDPVSVFGCTLSALYLVTCFLGFGRFVLWDSAVYFTDLNPYYYLFEIPLISIFENAHGIRSGLAIPSLLLAEHTPLSQEQSFAVSAGCCLIFTASVINRTLTEVFKTSRTLHSLPILILLFTLGYFMNGRICYAFVGAALLMRAHICWFFNRAKLSRVIFFNLIGLIFLTVSSGAFVVGCQAVLTWLCFAALDLRKTESRPRLTFKPLVWMTPLLFMMFYQVNIFQKKLTVWHDGDYMMLLYHGPGAMLKEYFPSFGASIFLILLAIMIPLLLLSVLFALQNYPPATIYMFAVVIASWMMGLCGYSTLFTNLPTMILLAVVIASRRVFYSPHVLPERRLA